MVNWDKVKEVRNIIKYIILGAIILNIIIFKKSLSEFGVNVVLWLIIIFIENRIHKNKEKKAYYILIILLMIVVMICEVKIYDYINFIIIYYLVLLMDILKRLDKKESIIFIIIHFFIYTIGFLFKHEIYGLEHIVELEDIYVYIITLLIAILVHILDSEHSRLEKINKSLIQDILNIDNNVIAKERNRITQELHDFLGHSFMVISMRLEYIEKLVPIQEEKVLNEIREVKEINRSSINEFRTIIHSRKIGEVDESLEDKINELVKKINKYGLNKIIFNFDKSVESVKFEIKEILFKNVIEGITNSVVHGKAVTINISIQKSENKVKFSIKDDGIGCKNIVISTGLEGITRRFEDVGGNIRFYSKKDNGFVIIGEIPWGDCFDKINDCR